LLQLRNDVCIPHSSNEEKNKSRVSADHGEQPTDGGQTAHVFRFTSVTIFIRAGTRPEANVLHNVTNEIGHDQNGGKNNKVSGPIDVPMGATATARFVGGVGDDKNHHCESCGKRNIVTERPGKSGSGHREKPDDQSRPTSGTY